MGRVGDDLGIEFVVSVGDNFYETGLTGVDDPAFAASFTDIYTAPSLQTTWYTGNINRTFSMKRSNGQTRNFNHVPGMAAFLS